jgi:hypothetical protein
MMDDLTEWKKRADGGDSRYAIALALMAIAEAISDKGTKEVGIIDHVSSSLDDKFDTLIRVMERLPEEEGDTPLSPPLKRRWWHRT